MSDTVLSASGLSKTFGGGRDVLGRAKRAVHAVSDVSLQIARGRTLGLVGESGCGKSTLAKLLLGLLEPTAGSVRIGDTSIAGDEKSAYRRIQMVFQDPASSLNPKKTVHQILEAPLVALTDHPAETRRKQVLKALELVSLPESTVGRFPHELSGGQAQRVGLARALIVEPEVVVLDEAVSSLDVSVQARVLELLESLQRRLDVAYLFISHDLAVVDALCHDVMVMYLGRVVERGTRDQVLRAPRHPYTRALLSAVPVPGQRRIDAIALEGEPGSAANPPSGCVFHPRCYRAEARCRQEVPAEDAGEVNHPTACFFAHDSAPGRAAR